MVDRQMDSDKRAYGSKKCEKREKALAFLPSAVSGENEHFCERFEDGKHCSQI